MIKTIWNSISHLGVSEKYFEENSLTILYNRMAFFSVISLIIFSTYLFLFYQRALFVNITICISIIYLVVLFLNGFHKIYWARLCVSFGTVLWVSIYHVCFGGFVSQSLAVGAAIVINYVAFRKKPKLIRLHFAIHFGLYLMALIYASNFDPIIESIHIPLASIVSFIVSMGWVSLGLIMFHNEKEKLIQDLKIKNEELERTTIELERFTYIASHDLKSPLRTIISFGGLINRDIKNENFQGVNEKMNYVITGAQQMNYIIQGILEFSQLKNIENTERFEIDFNEVLAKAKLNLMDEISQRNAHIQAEHLPIFYGNEVEFILLFQNFIQNAIKYNKSSSPTVTISSHQSKNSISISFKDNGIGIDKEYHNRIFEYFKRLHNSSEFTGTGIGLGLCKRIVENYNGKISVDSKIGEGSSFTIYLPITNKGVAPAQNEVVNLSN